MESLNAYALVVYLAAGSASLVLLAAAYDAADPRLPAGVIITVSAVFVAAVAARPEAAPGALLIAGVGIAVAMIKSSHPEHLEASSAYALIGFPLLAGSIAAFWIFGPSSRDPRPHNRVEAVFNLGAVGALIASALVLSLMLRLHEQQALVDRMISAEDELPVHRYFSMNELIALAVPCILVLSLYALRWREECWRLAALQAPGLDCRATELMSLCVLVSGSAYVVTASYGSALPVDAIAALGVLIAIGVWILTTWLAPDSRAERKRLRRSGTWWSLLVADLVIFATLLVSGNNVVPALVVLAIWSFSAAMIRPFHGRTVSVTTSEKPAEARPVERPRFSDHPEAS